MVKCPKPPRAEKTQNYVAHHSFLPLYTSWKTFLFQALFLYLTAAKSYIEAGPCRASCGLLNFPFRETRLSDLLSSFWLSSVNRFFEEQPSVLG